ncbi:MAG: glycosyltransferase [Pedosphaera sp.]|nr:glycosyltransferase [Pedosphaera sp.]
MKSIDSDRPLKILRVAQVQRNRIGGMSRTLFLTGDALEALGHSVDYWFEEDLKVALPPQLWRFVAPWKLWRRLAAELRRGTCWDIVEFHEPIGAFLTALPIGSTRSVALSYGLEERSHFAFLEYRQRANIPVSFKQRYSPLTVVWQAQRSVRHADHVLCSNSIDVRYLVNDGVDPTRVTRHFSGVESVFLKTDFRPAESRSRILFVGTWIDRKGIREIVPAVSALLREDSKLTFTAAGTGIPEGQVLEGFDPILRHRIRVISKIEGSDTLIRLYGEHAVLVLASYFEGHPLVLVEAAAQGLPAVGTDIGGISDFITHGQDGLIIPVAAPLELEAALRRMLKNPELRNRFGTALRIKALGFTWEASARNIEAAFRTTLRQTHRR